MKTTFSDDNDNHNTYWIAGEGDTEFTLDSQQAFPEAVISALQTLLEDNTSVHHELTTISAGYIGIRVYFVHQRAEVKLKVTNKMNELGWTQAS